MIKLCGFFIVMFTLTASTEFFVLRRWSNRWSISASVFCVAVFSGLIWLSSWMMLDWGDDPEALAQEPPMLHEEIQIIIILYLIFTAIALIPASVTALIYRKSKKNLLSSESPG